MSITSIGRSLGHLVLGRFLSAEGTHRARYGPGAPTLAALRAMSDDELIEAAATCRDEGRSQDAVFGEEFARRREGALNPFLAGRTFRGAVTARADAMRPAARDATLTRARDAEARDSGDRLDDDGAPVRRG
jgi:hypothetical protein